MRIASLALAGLAVFSLSACQSLRDAAGLTKQSPDEFAVVTKAPLIIPPDFNLKPPTPGAAPLNQTDPTDAAQAALFTSDTTAIAAALPGSYTAGERMLLANAGVQKADPAIRAELQSDARSMQGADDDFTNRVINGATTPVINQSLQVPKTKKKSGGWFDWF